MLDAEQVVFEAYPRWEMVSYYTGWESYIPVEMYAYDAVKAIKSVEQEYPDDPFWDAMDWEDTVARFIDYADGRLAEKGMSYELMMGQRSRDIAKLQSGSIRFQA